jgi:hypothetical protein
MAITIFTILPMSAVPERVFLGVKHIIGVERIRLGATMLEMAESLKSWVHIMLGRDYALLSGVFVNRDLLDEAIRALEAI